MEQHAFHRESIRDGRKDEVRPGHWLGLVHCLSFITSTLMVRWQQGHLSCVILVPLTARGSFLEHVVEEDSRGNQLIQLHLENSSN